MYIIFSSSSFTNNLSECYSVLCSIFLKPGAARLNLFFKKIIIIFVSVWALLWPSKVREPRALEELGSAHPQHAGV